MRTGILIPANEPALQTKAHALDSEVLLQQLLQWYCYDLDSVTVQTCVEADCLKVVLGKTEQIHSEALYFVFLAVKSFPLKQESLNPLTEALFLELISNIFQHL